MVTSNPGSINCGTVCTTNYDSGAYATLTTIPVDDVSRFTGWSGGCSGSGACVISLAAATMGTVTFARRSVLHMTRDGDDMPQWMDPVSLTITNIGSLGVNYAFVNCTVANLDPAGSVDNAGMAYDSKIDGFWVVDLGRRLFQYNPNAGMARN